ncbi:MAG: translation initiation factor eIF-1A [Nanoarchaeota archaeon]|nr:translation initiation factor eIF-1A [Nanoarchaeota archaeon]MCK5630056.1 translation initiation factor eIF-1A [Nanoarchaeota archaeon]
MKKPVPKFKGKKKPFKPGDQEEQVIRLRMPRGRETLGILEQRLGGSRQKVRCLDGKTRICRIPGRLKRGLWVREGDILIIEPWEFSGDEKGDVVYKYTRTQAIALRKRGMVKQLEEIDEF